MSLKYTDKEALKAYLDGLDKTLKAVIVCVQQNKLEQAESVLMEIIEFNETIKNNL